MTLGEVLARARVLPSVGDFEIVNDANGVAHVLYITFVDNAKLGPGLAGTLGFMCPCSVFTMGTAPESLEIAPVVTCLTCVTK